MSAGRKKNRGCGLVVACPFFFFWSGHAAEISDHPHGGPHPTRGLFSIIFSRGERERRKTLRTQERENRQVPRRRLSFDGRKAISHFIERQRSTITYYGHRCEVLAGFSVIYWCLFVGGKVGSEAIQTFWGVWPTRSKDRSPAPETQQERARGGVRGPCSSDVCPPCLVLVGSIAHVLVVLGQTSGFSHLVQWCPCGVVDPAARHKRASV